MKYLFMFLLQVIHLWFEEFALEATQLCTSDFITLRDSLGTIGTNLSLQIQIKWEKNERWLDEWMNTPPLSVCRLI